jgi:O-antigen/teichoic acid export membrane protein
MVTSVAMDINELAVGKTLGFASVAQLSRAQGVMNMFHRDFMAAIRNVAYPALAKAHHEDEGAERRFASFVGNVTALAWVYYGFAALFPLELLRLMFGPQWDSSAPLVPWFCLAGALSAITSLVPTVMMACGHSRLVATAELGIQPLRMVCLFLVCYYLRSLEALAITSMLIACASVPYFYAFKQRCLPTPFRALGRQLLRNIVLVCISLAGASLLALQRPSQQALPLPMFALAVAVTGLSWLAGLCLLRHPLWQELRTLVRGRFARTP